MLPNPLTPRDLFINKVAKVVGTMLPAPNINKRILKNGPPGLSPPLRWSRRQAGLSAEAIQPAETQGKKGLMRSMGLNAILEHL